MLNYFRTSLIAGGLCITAVLCSPLAAKELPRHAVWGAKFSLNTSAGVTVTSVEPNMALFKAGLRMGDVVLKVNDQAIGGPVSWSKITASLIAGRQYKLVVRRSLEELVFSVELPPVQKERYDHLETTYTSIINDYGIRQQVIITKPKQMKEGEKRPALYILTGLSCSSVELTRPPGRSHNWGRTLRALVEDTGMVVLRVEKPGLGDSEGDCGSTDFKTELNGYEVAYKMLKSLPYVDENNVVVFGSSMGSAIAPYLANKYGAAGVISDGTFYRSWFEHMLEIERRIKRMQGKNDTEITTLMTQAYIPLYYGMLIEKKSYGDVINKTPSLAQYNYHGPDHMYGRPVQYYHQVQDFDFAGNWQNLKIPVRLRWGTNDWIMSEYDNDLIVSTLKRAGNTDVILEKYPGLDHWSTVHKSEEDSFNGRPGQWEEAIAGGLVAWARELAGLK
ncbi:PDZ domain-containing protein [Temperatibacter marinus]|uniref:PDZ domain-containing protein n=1 Tax=Temperatibacter marinus TaxID=1456591 RepID=A0AA52H9S7_9PROT|nr:PDZ domain-containing protein [Temperatibacter marinus]WND02000.1 PDZ domain-containing protein [Temperatibacter marinus]